MLRPCRGKDRGGGGGDDSQLREGSIGKTNDGHDVIVFEEGELEDVLQEFNIAPSALSKSAASDPTDVTKTGYTSYNFDDYKGTIVFKNLSPIKIPRVGDIIASGSTKNAPYGFLCKVTKVSTNGTNTVVTFDKASLTDAIKEGTHRSETTFELDEDGNVVNVLHKTHGAKGSLENVTDTREISLKNGSKLNTYLSHSITFILEADFDGFTLKYFKVSVLQRQNFEIKSQNPIKESMNNFSNNWPLVNSKQLMPITIPVCGVPVNITNSIDATLFIGGNGEIDMENMNLNIVSSSEYGYEYKQNICDSTINWRKVDIGSIINFPQYLPANIRFSTLVSLNTMFYGFGGLFVGAGPGVELSVVGNPSGVYVFDDGFRAVHDSVFISTTKNKTEVWRGEEMSAGLSLGIFGMSFYKVPFVGAYVPIKPILITSHLPIFRDPEITRLVAYGAVGQTVLIDIGMYGDREGGYPIEECGICIEKVGSDDCKNGEGMRKIVYGPGVVSSAWWRYNWEHSPWVETRFLDPPMGYRLEISASELESGTYNIRPYFTNGIGGTFYDKATVYEHVVDAYGLGVQARRSDDDTPMGTVVLVNKTPPPHFCSSSSSFNSWCSDDTVGMSVYTVATAGTPVKIKAIPEDGYQFIGWTVNSGRATFADEKSAATSVTLIDRSASIIANFSQPWTLKVSQKAHDGNQFVTGGTVTADKQTDIAFGEEVAITAVPNDGWQFVKWTVYDEYNWNPSIVDDSTAEITTITVNNSKTTVTAVFSQISTPTTYTLTVRVSDDLNDKGSVTPARQTDLTAGKVVEITATPKSGYVFSHWRITNGAGSTIADSTATTTTVTVNSTTSIRGYFVPVYTLTVDRDPIAGGSVTPSAQQTDVPAGKVVEITATPASGYAFLNWAVTGGGTIAEAKSATTSVTVVNGNATVTAYFSPIYTLTVDASSTAGGSVTPEDQQTGILPGTSVNITATPASGYIFVNWTVTGGSSVASLFSAATSVAVNGNTTVTANFQPQPVIVPPSGDEFTDSRDGKTYRMVTIGSQTWMAENLNYFVDDNLPDNTLDLCYNNSPDSCAKYGRLYDWNTAMGGAASSSAVPSGVQGACPVGWHLPSVAEWGILINSVGGESTAGKKLKSGSYWDYWGDAAGTDDFGFSALPGGWGDHWSGGNWSGGSDGVVFNNAKIYGFFWSAEEYENPMAPQNVQANVIRMDYSSFGLGSYSNSKRYLYSVRCVQDGVL